MKKYTPLLNFSLLIFWLEILAILVITTPTLWTPTVYYFNRISAALILVWVCGILYLGIKIKKSILNKVLSRLFAIGNLVFGGMVLLCFSTFLLARLYPYHGNFSTTTTLFHEKDVMIIVPHQDDDIILAGGLIEQYIDSGSDVTIVFTTNGDRHIDSNIRADEVVQVMADLGVPKENVYYLGFGDQWVPQPSDGTEIGHIYNSPDPNGAWTSLFGATTTYGTNNFDCYRDLPYTRKNYLDSFQALIQENMPDTIFAVDYDRHVDHRATDLFFEEALHNVLVLYPDYHPTVYKGFAYGTAWNAVADYFDSLNPLSTAKPDESIWSRSAYGYDWENRVRFPISRANLNPMLTNNSVYHSLDQYRSQLAYSHATSILNGDKVFWERRTDSLLYTAQIFIGDQETSLLNDFKLKEFDAIATEDCANSGFIPLWNQKVVIHTDNPITINSIKLYDNPDPAANILAGYIVFSDGSKIEFSPLNQEGSGTTLSFPKKNISWMEIVVTETDSETAGLSEVEAFCDEPAVSSNTDHYLMALDPKDHFVYDYLLHESNSVELSICSYPNKMPMGEQDLLLSFDSTHDSNSCSWENDVLTVTCKKGSTCTVTISDGDTDTTFTVSNPSDLEYAYMQALRYTEKVFLNLRELYAVFSITFDYYVGFIFRK